MIIKKATDVISYAVDKEDDFARLAKDDPAKFHTALVTLVMLNNSVMRMERENYIAEGAKEQDFKGIFSSECCRHGFEIWKREAECELRTLERLFSEDAE